MQKRTRVFLATSDSLISIGTYAALATDSTIDLVQESFASPMLLLKHYLDHAPCVLVFPTTHCKEAVKLIQLSSHSLQSLAIVVVAITYDEECVRELLQLSASGFVLVTDPAALLQYAVHAVALGSSWFATSTTNQFYANLQHSNDATEQEPILAKLTQREREVLLLLRQGWHNEQIAITLKVTERTIRFHIRNIYDKLNFSSRSEAIVWALQASSKRS